MRASRCGHRAAMQRPRSGVSMVAVTTCPDALEIDGVPVALVAWPVGDARRRALAAGGHPRLLLVAAGADPPESDDVLEDWLRLPRDLDDIPRRARRLGRLAAGSS